jgi:predicted RNA-binding Zn-ribbon protein involved in translation (DUF1610 family)
MIFMVIIYILLSVSVGIIARDRRIGFIQAFVFSLFLTPIAGLAVVMKSDKLILYHMVQYGCPECGYHSEKAEDYCPHCREQGKYVILKPNIIPTT